MSYENFINAVALAGKCEFYRTAGGKSKRDILKSEELLGVKFSRQSLEFYERLGYLSFSGNEIYGIDPDDNSGILAGNSVAFALNDRKEYNLPEKWIPIYNFDDGYMGYLDYSQLNKDGEPPVIMAIYNGTEYKVTERVAEDLGDFILAKVEESIESEE